MELLQHVRATPDLARTPFVLVTAETTREKVVQAIQAGVDDYIDQAVHPGPRQQGPQNHLEKGKPRMTSPLDPRLAEFIRELSSFAALGGERP